MSTTKSIEFVKNRIRNGMANVPLRDDAKFFEGSFDSFVDSGVKIPDASNGAEYGFNNGACSFEYKNVNVSNDSGQDLSIGDIRVNISHDENADFEYFTMERCLCDGTLYFMYELMCNTLLKVLRMQTVNNTKIPDNFGVSRFSYDFNYTVGNFVCCEEFGEFEVEGHTRRKSRFTVMLPIKFDIKKREDI